MCGMVPLGDCPTSPRQPPQRGRAVLAILMLAGGLVHAQSPSTSPAPSASPAATLDRASTTDERLRRLRERKQSIERHVARLRGQEQSLLADVERLDLQVRLRTEQLREAQLVLHHASEQRNATSRRLRQLKAALA